VTIICFRDGIMAADGQRQAGSVIVGTRTRKIERLADGSLMGCAGDAVVIQRVVNHFRTPGKPGKFYSGMWLQDLSWEGVEVSDFTALVARIDGTVWKIYNKGEVYLCGSEESFHATGEPYEMARGMMLAGASAEQAVELCCANHAHCGGTVQIERLEAQPDIFDDGTGVSAADAAIADSLEAEREAFAEREKSWAWAERMGIS
jgi:hypothetical protein